MICAAKYSEDHTLYAGDHDLKKKAVKKEFNMILEIIMPLKSYANLNFAKRPCSKKIGRRVLLADLPASVINIEEMKLR